MKLFLITITAVVLMGSPAAGQEEPTTTTVPGVPNLELGDLLSDQELWDGRRISVTGELVGDYSPRPDGVWVQLNDDAFVGAPIGRGGEPLTTNTGIGARIPTRLFEVVEGEPGRYGIIGPRLQLTGIFRHNDPSLGGETFLEVEEVALLQPSTPYSLPGPDPWILVGTGLVVAAGVVAWRTRRKAEH